ncbi:MAG: hypothetical protein R3D30_02995 [Hyphomicrobiales bacterium]
MIEVHLDLGGTAGDCRRHRGDKGGTRRGRTKSIRRALARAEDADLVLWVVDATSPVSTCPTFAAKSAIKVLNKSDIAPPELRKEAAKDALLISAKTRGSTA